MADVYTRYYANPRHNGYVEASSNAVGNVAWRRRIHTGENGQAEARLILSSGNVVVVDGMRELFAFNASGDRLWHRPKRPGMQVALHDGLVYLFAHEYGNYLEAVSLAGEVKKEGVPIPDVGEAAYLVIMEPTEDGLVAQVQYTDQPDFVTSEVLVYRLSSAETAGLYAWSKGFPQRYSPLVPFACTQLRRLVTSLPGEALVFDLDAKDEEPEPMARFPFPLGDKTVWISCDGDGHIHWLGYDPNAVHLAVTDFNGETVHQWNSEGITTLHRRNPIAPAVITPERTYLVTPRNLLAISDNKLAWNFESPRGEFRACTALADGTVLATTWDTLYRLNDRGEIMFDEILDEPLVTPPVVDEKGMIYVAGAETLYALK